MIRIASGRVLARDVLAVHSPQLAQDESVEQRRHVQHWCLRLFCETGQNDLDVLRYVRIGLQWDRLTQECGAIVQQCRVLQRPQQQPRQRPNVGHAIYELLGTDQQTNQLDLLLPTLNASQIFKPMSKRESEQQIHHFFGVTLVSLWDWEQTELNFVSINSLQTSLTSLCFCRHEYYTKQLGRSRFN